MFNNESVKFKKNFLNNIVFLKTISEPNRLKIIHFLSKGEQCVCDIWKSLDIPQNLTSHHLKVLKESNLIDSRQEGRKVIYFLNKNNLKQNIKALSSF